jgi:hypothetical protein
MPQVVRQMLRRIAAYVAPGLVSGPQVADADGLARYLSSLAAFVSQKCTVEYLRLRGGLHWEELCRSPAFKAGLERCRWEGYGLALGDIAELCQGLLLRRGLAAAEIEPMVTTAVAGALARYPMPAHRTDWEDVTQEITARLAEARLAEPRPLRRMGGATARRLMALYPFDERLRAADLDYLRNNLRLALAQSYERMTHEIDVGALVGRTCDPLHVA